MRGLEANVEEGKSEGSDYHDLPLGMCCQFCLCKGLEPELDCGGSGKVA